MLAGVCAHAQGVVDPTRPPDAVETAPDTPGGGTGLQSVMISDTRKAAIIGGQLVQLGQKYGDATLVRVAESEVTLARGRETQVLYLFPGIEKKMVSAERPPGEPRKVQGKSKSRGTR
jgi:MSHA biogenesis protein MshK